MIVDSVGSALIRVIIICIGIICVGAWYFFGLLVSYKIITHDKKDDG